MKHKIVSMIGLISSLVVIVAGILYLVKRIMIPGLMPFGVVVIMASLVYLVRKLFKEGKVSKGYWRLMVFILGVAGVMNLYVGILQLSTAIAK